METGIHLGNKVDKEVVETAASKILDILEARADQKTIRLALEVLKESVTIPEQDFHGVHISDCSLGDTYAEPKAKPRRKRVVK